MESAITDSLVWNRLNRLNCHHKVNFSSRRSSRMSSIFLVNKSLNLRPMQQPGTTSSKRCQSKPPRLSPRLSPSLLPRLSPNLSPIPTSLIQKRSSRKDMKKICSYINTSQISLIPNTRGTSWASSNGLISQSWLSKFKGYISALDIYSLKRETKNFP